MQRLGSEMAKFGAKVFPGPLIADGVWCVQVGWLLDGTAYGEGV